MELNSVTQSKNCLACGSPLKGRADKKFCDDFCRNGYNNRLKSGSNNFIRNINNALRKNRRVLESLIPPGHEMSKTTKEILLNMGFQFKYHTHLYTNKKGGTYFFCYEFGYLSLENDWFLIVKRKKSGG